MSMTRIEAMRHIQSQGYNNVNDVPYNELPPVLREYATPRAPEGMQRPVARGPAEQAPAPTSGETAGAPVADSGEETSGGFLNSLLGIGGEALELAPGIIYDAARRSLPGEIGNMVDATVRTARSPADSAGNAGVLTTMDRATYGLLDTIAQGQAQAETRQLGGDNEQIVEAGQEARDTVNNNLMLARDEHRIATTVGDIAGTIISGGPIMSAATTIPRVGTSTILTAATAAGIEEGLYTLNSDGSIEEAAANAGTAAVLGGVGAKAFEMLGGVGRLAFGRPNREFQERLGAEIYRVIEADHIARTGQAMPPGQAAQLLARADPEQVLTDLYPDLMPQLRALAASGDDSARRTMLSILERRNDLNFNHRDMILDAVRGNQMRSEEAFGAYLNQQRAALRPQYDALFDDMDAAQWAREVPTIRDSITRLINPQITGHGDDLSNLMSMVDNFSNGRNRMTFRQVNELRKEVQDAIHRRLRYNASPANADNLPIGNLQAASRYLRGMLETNDQFARLQRTYGDIGDARNAYTFAMNTVSRSNLLGEDAQLFYSGQPSDLVAEALVEGGRFGLFTKARGPNPMSALTEARIEDLGAFIGPDAAQEVLQQAQRAAAMEATREATETAARSTPQQIAEAFRGQTFMDMAVASQALTGDERGVGVAFAGRRLLERALGNNPRPYSGELRRASRMGAEAYTSNSAAASAVDAFADRNRPTIPGVLGMATGATAAEPSNALGAGAIDAGEQFSQYLMDRLFDSATR